MNKKIYKIGITGGIGSGKSLVAQIFTVFGIPVYDADSRAKWLMANNPALKNQLSELFGENAYVGGELNRAFIAEQAFHNPELLNKLNNLVHPQVAIDYSQWALSHPHAPYTLKEAALMYESGSANGLDKVINISAPKAIRVQRVLLRDAHRTEKQIEAIIGKQMPDEERKLKADFNINNDGTKLLIPQSLKIHQELLRQISI